MLHTHGHIDDNSHVDNGQIFSTGSHHELSTRSPRQYRHGCNGIRSKKQTSAIDTHINVLEKRYVHVHFNVMERKILAIVINTILCTNNQMIHMLKLDMRLLEAQKDRDETLMSKVDILKALAMIIESNAKKALDALESMKPDEI